MVSALDALSLALLVGAGGVGAAVRSSLPRRMAIRWGLGGDPNGYAPRPLALAFLPALGVVVLASIRGLLTAGPASEPAAFGVVLAAFLSYVHGLVLAWNLGYRVNVTVALLPALLALGGATVVL
jgi:hypothetical protein